MLKKYLSFLFLFCVHNYYAQIGINTTSPDETSILDIKSNNKGILIPSHTTDSQNEIFRPAHSLLIYNTDEKALKFNKGTKDNPDWFRLNRTNLSVKCSNTNFSARVNNGNRAPFMGQIEWNDHEGLYEVQSGRNQIKVNQSGIYLIIVNASLINNTNRNLEHLSANMQLGINGDASGPFASTAYTRGVDNHTKTSLHLNVVLELNAGDNISVRISRTDSFRIGLVSMRFRSAESSNIYIEKL